MAVGLSLVLPHTNRREGLMPVKRVRDSKPSCRHVEIWEILFLALGTLISRRALSPLVRLVDGEERWEASDHPEGLLPQNLGGTEPNHTVTCMVLKATANDRRTASPLPR
ncbi:uncharacterized protein TNCV_326031 [Trichonephila clavipes]|nr:uncharacterized protein TNCV_326031 [Trichonephila clavipes]